MTLNKRILVDLSATLIHHGHIRLLKRAKKLGKVIVALTTDQEIILNKGYKPELAYENREEILLSIKYVDEVIPSPWLINEEFIAQHNIDLLVHGNDNSNPINKDKLLLFERTKGISSTLLRKRVMEALKSKIDFDRNN